MSCHNVPYDIQTMSPDAHLQECNLDKEIEKPEVVGLTNIFPPSLGLLVKLGCLLTVTRKEFS